MSKNKKKLPKKPFTLLVYIDHEVYDSISMKYENVPWEYAVGYLCVDLWDLRDGREKLIGELDGEYYPYSRTVVRVLEERQDLVIKLGEGIHIEKLLTNPSTILRKIAKRYVEQNT
jgi:hypothetical protein